MDHFLRRLGNRWGRAIRLFPAALDASAPCGLLVSTETVDYVCYAANTSLLHRQHIILHEIGHLELYHEGRRINLPPDDPQPRTRCRPDPAGREPSCSLSIVEQLMPHLSPSAIRRLLARTVYVADEEREAELFATLAGDRISRSVGKPLVSVPRDMTVVRLRSIFDIRAPRGHNRG